jgi:hypothetical protein
VEEQLYDILSSWASEQVKEEILKTDENPQSSVCFDETFSNDEATIGTNSNQERYQVDVTYCMLIGVVPTRQDENCYFLPSTFLISSRFQLSRQPS